MKLKIAVLPGDGIGPEISAQGVEVTKAVCEKFGHEVSFEHALCGADAIDKVGDPFPEETFRICQEAVKTMMGFTLAHVGINCANADEAAQTAKTLCALFGLEYKAGNSSDFAGSMVECNKAPGRGANGHIAIGTYNVDRAVYHLGLQGVRFDQASRKTDAKGNTKAIYLQDEVGGFAIHLVKR